MMPAVPMRALHSFVYNTRRLKAGDEFTTTGPIARIYVVMRKAEVIGVTSDPPAMPEPVVAAAAVVEPEPVIEEQAVPRARRGRKAPDPAPDAPVEGETEVEQPSDVAVEHVDAPRETLDQADQPEAEQAQTDAPAETTEPAAEPVAEPAPAEPVTEEHPATAEGEAEPKTE